MQNSQLPAKIPQPFANSASRNAIPNTTSTTVATYPGGFPPLTAADPVLAGGIPPTREDFNGILFAATAWNNWSAAGGFPVYDGTFATTIGGYPNGAVLQSADFTGWWRSTADNNTSNPDTGGANWLPHWFYGLSGATLASTNVTLTAVQYAKPILNFTGTISANIQIIFPAGVIGQWLVQNNTSGAFTVSAKTSGGSNVPVLAPGSNLLYSDGSNVFNCSFLTSANFTGAQSVTANGYQTLPGGLIMQWGTYTSDITGDGGTATITFPLAFPTGILFAMVGERYPTGASDADGHPGLAATTSTTLTAVTNWAGVGSSPTCHGFNWLAIGH